jgi:CSLREA domain-containing protein
MLPHSIRGIRPLVLAALVAAAVSFAPTAAAIAIFHVDSTADSPDARTDGRCADSSGRCTLRAAVDEANHVARTWNDKTVIWVPTGYYGVKKRLVIHGTVDIYGHGPNATTIIGPGEDDWLFELSSSAGLHLLDLKAEDATIVSQGDLMLGNTTLVRSGGIFNYGMLSGSRCRFENGTDTALVNVGFANLTDCSFLNNGTSRSWGGAILNGGKLFASFTLFYANVGDKGGAIRNLGSFEVTDCQFLANVAYGAGGAIHSEGAGESMIRKSSIDDNSSHGVGGGISVAGALDVENTSILGNLARSDGGGIWSEGDGLRLASVTVAGNVAGYGGGSNAFGGGLYVEGGESAVRAVDSIVALNEIFVESIGLGPDCVGVVDSAGYNLLGIDEGCRWQGGADDLLGTAGRPLDPLLDDIDAGPNATRFRRPLAGSPAVDSGDPAGCRDWAGKSLGDDQIGGKRDQGSACDRGAIERPFHG